MSSAWRLWPTLSPLITPTQAACLQLREKPLQTQTGSLTPSLLRPQSKTFSKVSDRPKKLLMILSAVSMSLRYFSRLLLIVEVPLLLLGVTVLKCIFKMCSIKLISFSCSVSVPERLDFIVNKYAEHTHEKWSLDKVLYPKPQVYWTLTGVGGGGEGECDIVMAVFVIYDFFFWGSLLMAGFTVSSYVRPAKFTLSSSPTELSQRRCSRESVHSCLHLSQWFIHNSCPVLISLSFYRRRKHIAVQSKRQ